MLKYQGGKFRLRQEITKLLKENRKDNQSYLEAFCGGLWIVENMDGYRVANDANPYLICLYRAIQKGWLPPDNITKEMYDTYNKSRPVDDPLTGFIGFAGSYRSKFFGGWNGTGKRNYLKEGKDSILKYRDNIKDILFTCCDYSAFTPNGLLIYCDPPYKDTTGYATGEFNTSKFWDTMREWRKRNTVIISEYSAPDDFRVIHSVEQKVTMDFNKEYKVAVEKLFM